MSSKRSPANATGVLVKKKLKKLGVSVVEAAGVLDVSYKHLYNMLDGTSALTTEMALRLEKAFGNKAETWMHLELERLRVEKNKELGRIYSLAPQQPKKMGRPRKNSGKLGIAA